MSTGSTERHCKYRATNCNVHLSKDRHQKSDLKLILDKKEESSNSEVPC